jgi:hypothetical protein
LTEVELPGKTEFYCNMENGKLIVQNVIQNGDMQFLPGAAKIYVSDDYIGETSMNAVLPNEEFILGTREAHDLKIEKKLVKRSTDKGATWSPDARLTFDPGWSVMPSLWASGAKVHLIWYDDLHGNEEIYYRCSEDSGLTWSGEERLSYGRYNSTYPSIFTLDSVVHVVWTDSRSGNPEIYYTRNPTGNSGTEEEAEGRAQRQGFNITAVPIPFVSFASVPGHEKEWFGLYDVSGRKVGTYRGDKIGWDAAPGVYFLKPVDKKAAPARIVKIR